VSDFESQRSKVAGDESQQPEAASGPEAESGAERGSQPPAEPEEGETGGDEAAASGEPGAGEGGEAPAEEPPAGGEEASAEAAPPGGAASAGEERPEGADADEEEKKPEVGVPGMDWYIIHTYSGFENKVKESLKTRAEAFGYDDRIGEILIPTEDVVEMRGGKKVTTKRLLYRGYVLVQLDLDDELWHVVRNTPRVTGFVGGGRKPQPLSANEVNQILYRQATSAERPRPKMTFERNDRVKIIDGPFTNFTGTVEEVNEERNTLKVMVTIFGRGTPVELEYFQVEKEKV